MFLRWFQKNKLQNDLNNLLENCNYGIAKQILIKQYSGKVFPTELTKLLDDFVTNPCQKTAIDLLKFDSKFVYVFELAQKDGFTSRMFVK